MKKLAFAATLLAFALAASISMGASHREAPLTSLDPSGDNTDTYAFTAKDAPGALTIAANWIPFEDPAGGPNFYRFDDNARYYTNIDNTGDGKPDIRYRFTFKTNTKNKESFLYGLGGEVRKLDDENLNLTQTYTVVREELRDGGLVSSKVVGRNLLTPPNNVGPKTTPDYADTAAAAVHTLKGGGKVFAGQRDDPFFISLGRVFDTVNLTGAGLGNEGGGVDDLAGYSVHSTVVQLPEAQVTRDGKPAEGPNAPNAVVGVWSTTERPNLNVATGEIAGEYQQVSRLGNPLVNEVVIPMGQKDRFNRTTPDQDAKNYGKYVIEPELARVLNALFPDVKAPEKNRTDIVQAVLQGVPGLNAFPGKAGKNATDTIKVNLAIPPTSSPNRLGVLAKDNQGYPNGRRLEDDVTDISLQVVAGALKGNEVPLGDGVNENDVPFKAAFPYLADPGPGANPDAGYASKLKAATPTLAAAAAETGGEKDEDDGPSAIVYVLIALGGVALGALAVSALRRERHKTAA
jgi:Domain of unknown function (DUF4331)